MHVKMKLRELSEHALISDYKTFGNNEMSVNNTRPFEAYVK